METKLKELKQRLQQASDIASAAALLSWDQSTYMPPGGAVARGRQMGTLHKLAHQKATDPAIGQLLDDLQPYAASLDYEHDDAALLRIARRQYERHIKIPAEFLAQFTAHTAKTYSVWTQARPANDFATVQPLLEQTLEMSRQMADFFPGYEHIADPLIDFADFGMQAATVRTVFADLREQLVPIVQAITAQPPADEACLHHTYPIAQQTAFFTDVIKDFGFDFERGRQDVSPHPFTTKFASGDVRITVRYRQNDLGDALFSALHEAGHGMYELGVNPAYEGTPLGHGTSSGVHESQSRLWENIVGRSRGFWTHYYPKLQEIFPQQLNNVTLDTFYRAINKVQPSPVRVDADEVTYNLHVMLRFEFELALLEGTLAVKDLPAAWNARMESDLGITPPNDSDGVLQDIHWYGIHIGGVFQGYTLGNILSAQFYQAALDAHPSIPNEIARGQFGTLHGWLKDNIYVHGSKFAAPELIQRVTGSPLDIKPYISYLRTKYGELYTL